LAARIDAIHVGFGVAFGFVSDEHDADLCSESMPFGSKSDQPERKCSGAAMRENKTTFKWFFMPLILFSHLLPMKMENDLFKDKKT
jgi:hypothetical protein